LSARYARQPSPQTPRYDSFSCWRFAQLTWREVCATSKPGLVLRPKLYTAGIRHLTARSTLADANENRDWRYLCRLCQVLIRQAATLNAE